MMQTLGDMYWSYLAVRAKIEIFRFKTQPSLADLQWYQHLDDVHELIFSEIHQSINQLKVLLRHSRYPGDTLGL